jgi:hypothetical protein
MRGLAAGAVGGAVSFGVLKRTDLVDLFGIEMPNWGSDLILIAASSATGEVVGGWALPMVEKWTGTSGSLANFVNMSLDPLLAGTMYTFGKEMAVAPSRPDERMKNFGLGLFSKLAGDKLMDAMKM